MIQLIKWLLVIWNRPKAGCHRAVGWSMQFRELSCGKALVMGIGNKLWIVGLTITSHASCYQRSLS